MAEKFHFQPTPLTRLRKHYDVIVIGSGAAGMTAAIQAHELGLSPVILEKMDKLGGNTNRASSGMNAAETNVQLKHHVVDSFQEFYDETLKGGGGQNNTELLKYFSEHAALAIDWLADHDIQLDEITITGGMSKMRTHRPHSLAAIGGFLVTELLKQVQKARIPLFSGLKVTELTTDDDGKVTGVRATTGKQSGPLTADAVILAAGGFGANQDMLAKYRPDLKGMETTNQPGATGDGIKLAQALGAKLVDMDQVQVHPTVQQDTPHAYLIGEAVRGEGAILVNKHGDRFVNELDTRKNVTAAIDGLNENGAYLIFDQGIRDRAKAVEFYDSIGLVHTGQSLDDLASQLGFDAATLKQTVSDWNTAVADQNDSAFNRTTGMDRDISTAPFFAIHIAPAIHYTMGGIAINHKTEVLNEDGKAIKGLYAAGEIVGGLHGNNRIGGNSIAETVIFGRQAGEQVFNYINEK
ncbi:flavocytochrome c [Lactobacillus sp. LC28-10]|uniref:Flavocytochrome c n=1 Tax=Secundilactobacillus angelensis TaxID=2722706 RepID=A0ABX1KX05_9LACO|nr:flavocytochrome c [Secundilactobacillus angelensis]MCH5461876.1 flavocytochrome c [Secundilactobacillus angelensis]NLR17363.1 flavocytochrome c [Secundilactobacillus angelensis]